MESSFWNNILPPEESSMINRHILEHQVDLRLETELAEIIADDQGRVNKVRTKQGEEIHCQFVGLTAGVSPNIDFLKSSYINTDRGILINEYFETNIQDVYAVGDCAQFRHPLSGRKPIEQVWYTGRMHGETLAQTICNKKTAYDPGIWFNSAKFFDIEYQVYGDIRNKLPENQASLFWAHENGKHSIRIAYDKSSTKVLGFNLMGIRYRHEVCEQWIKNGALLRDVIKNLKKANFDPEFSKAYDVEMRDNYNKNFPDSPIRSTSTRGLFALLQ